MKDLRALNGLRVHRENTRSNWLMAHNDVVTLIQYFVQLIESIKHYGTPKFARQARLAFISKAISRSLVYRGYFTDKEIDDFMKKYMSPKLALEVIEDILMNSMNVNMIDQYADDEAEEDPVE